MTNIHDIYFNKNQIIDDSIPDTSIPDTSIPDVIINNNINYFNSYEITNDTTISNTSYDDFIKNYSTINTNYNQFSFYSSNNIINDINDINDSDNDLEIINESKTNNNESKSNNNESKTNNNEPETNDLLFDFDFNVKIDFTTINVNTKKSKCYCNMPTICNECFTRFISKKSSHSCDNYNFIKLSHINIPSRLLKNFHDLNNGIILDSDDMKTYHNLIINTFFTNSRRTGPFICKQPIITKKMYNQLPIGEYDIAEQYINYKIWHYFINPIEESRLNSLENKLQTYKFLCYPDDQCFYLCTYNQLIKNKIFHFISYDDYKTALHVCLYHPIII